MYVGVMELTDGVGLVTVKLLAAEDPPPGAGLLTVTETVLPAVRADAGIWACSDVALTYVVERATPLKITEEEAIKLDPVTVSVCAAAPAVTLVGFIAVTLGTGF